MWQPSVPGQRWCGQGFVAARNLSSLWINLCWQVSYKLFWVLKETNQWEFAHMDEIVAHYSEAREGSPVTTSAPSHAHARARA
jgi:hypothetical protein